MPLHPLTRFAIGSFWLSAALCATTSAPLAAAPRSAAPVAAAQSTAPLPASAQPSWQRVAEADIRAAHALIEQAHPAILEPDAAFHAWHHTGFQQALARAEQADTAARAWAALRFYLVGYQDGHVAAQRADQPFTQARWAGFNVRTAQGRYIVSRIADRWPAALPRVGDELVSCDGQPVADWLAQRVAPDVDRRSLLASRQLVALFLTNQWDGQQLWDATPPTACIFRAHEAPTRDRRPHRLTLVWQDSFEGLTRWRADAPPQSMLAPTADLRWIHASDFQTEDGPRLDALLKDIASVGDQPQVTTVVLDVRGNQGGNSLIGDRILKALLKDRAPHADAKAEALWRVSDVALNSLAQRLDSARRLEGDDGPTVRLIQALQARMLAARERGEALVVQPESDPNPDPAPDSIPDAVSDRNLTHTPAIAGRPFSGKLVLLTDRHCASACLDFVDAVLKVPHVVHAGEPTSGDTRYMDIARVPLPSGAQLALPLKVWRGRARGDNAPHVPAFPDRGNPDDLAAGQSWVIHTVIPRAQPIGSK